MAYSLRVIPNKKRRTVQSAGARKATKARQVSQVVESCLGFLTLKERVSCNLPQQTLDGLREISSPAMYSKGAILFVEGEEPRGVFVICSGRVKLSAGSAGGRSLILRITEPGEVVGLAGTISGKPYEVTAEALEPIQANFIPREAFLQFLREHGEVALSVAEMLSEIYHAMYQQVRYLGLSGSAAAKLARFLLDLAGSGNQGGGPIPAGLAFTHVEIAEMIGTSRETVTRLFANFKEKQLVEVYGSTLIIKNKRGLRQLLEA